MATSKPRRLKRPKLVGVIATGQVKDEQPRAPTSDEISRVMAALGRAGGLKGGKARAKSLSPERRAKIAKAAAARWDTKRKSNIAKRQNLTSRICRMSRRD
jgi:hypothetical protein